MLQLPNEVLRMIIDCVMLHDDPLFLDHFLAGTRQPLDNRTRNPKFDSSLVETEICPIWTPRLYSLLSQSQRPHLLDWCFVNSTCRLLRGLGKPAFFAQKTFIMYPELADRFRHSRVRGLSMHDQQIAKHNFTSLVFAVSDYFFVPKSVLSLPTHLEIFPRAIHIGYMACYDRRETPEFYLECVRRRRKPPACFIECLTLMSIDVEKLDLSIMTDTDELFQRCEQNILSGIYPLLRHIWTIKAQKINSGMIS
ncbi:hypothetical protein EMCG_02603 [[Emmonsia] crescens]|uniref:Uncharacterized protein n=1 Tax=[Emmonsia] crescens TaxID=73230 RepID=A0A0G2HY50_9EURO|nr:hypothetical protein EMCG_02603 [Emmonsia crescens UAMH 3008]